MGGKVDEGEYNTNFSEENLESIIKELPINQPAELDPTDPEAMKNAIREAEKEELKASIASAKTDLDSKFGVLKRYNDKIASGESKKNDAIKAAESKAKVDSEALSNDVKSLSFASEYLNAANNYNKYLELIECTTRDNINNPSETNEKIIDNLIKFGTKTEQDSIKGAIEPISEKMKTTIETGDLDKKNTQDVVKKYKSANTEINEYIGTIQQTNYDAALNPETYVCNTLANEDKAAKTESRRKDSGFVEETGKQEQQQQQVAQETGGDKSAPVVTSTEKEKGEEQSGEQETGGDDDEAT